MYILPFFLSMSSPIPLAGHVLARNTVEVNLSVLSIAFLLIDIADRFLVEVFLDL